MTSLLEHVGRGIRSGLTGISQAEIEDRRANREFVSANAERVRLGNEQIEREQVEQADIRGFIKDAMSLPVGQERQAALADLYSRSPQLGDMIFRSIGAHSQEQREDAARRAFEIQSVPPEQRAAVIQRQAERLQSEGRDPSDTIQLLDMSPEAQDAVLDVMQATALDAPQRQAQENTERQLGQGDAQIAQGDERLDIARDEVAQGNRALAIQEGRLFSELATPQKREMKKDAGGVLRYVDNGEPVFPADLEENASAQDSVEATRNLIGSILTHDSLGSVFGSVQGFVPSLFESTLDVESMIEQLKSNLTLDKIKNFKGAISDRDLEVAQSAATILNQTRISDEKAREELLRLYQAFGGELNTPDGGSISGNQISYDDGTTIVFDE